MAFLFFPSWYCAARIFVVEAHGDYWVDKHTMEFWVLLVQGCSSEWLWTALYHILIDIYKFGKHIRKSQQKKK